MTIEEKLAQATKKIQQMEHQKILQENRAKEAESKIHFRRIVIVGEIFVKHFPITLQFSPGKTKEENEREFKLLDKFLETLAQKYNLPLEMDGKRSQSY